VTDTDSVCSVQIKCHLRTETAWDLL